MRVLLTSHQFPPKYTFGTEKLTFECGRELLKRGHEVYVLTTEPASEELPHNEARDYEYQGLKVRVVGSAIGLTPDPLRYEFDNPQMAEHMRAYILENNPEMLHVYHAGRLSGSIIVAAREMGLPIVFTATDFWSLCRVIHLRRADTGQLCTGPDGAGVNCLRCYIARTGSPSAGRYLHRSDAELRAYMAVANSPGVDNTKYGNRIRAVSERIGFLKDAINSTDRVIAPTKLTRDMLIRNGIDSRLVRLSHYGIETSHISAVPKSTTRPEVIRFSSMSGLVRHKGIHNLMKAFRLVPENAPAELKVYGDSDRDPAYFSELEALAAGDPRIKFMGSFEGEKIGEVLSEIDVLVIPSAWYENTPLVLYQAFASGTPIVATDLGGLSEVIEHDVNGLLFGVNDPEDMSRQLRRFLNEPDLLSRLRDGIESPRTVADSVDELEEFYGEAIETRRNAGGNAEVHKDTPQRT